MLKEIKQKPIVCVKLFLLKRVLVVSEELLNVNYHLFSYSSTRWETIGVCV